MADRLPKQFPRPERERLIQSINFGLAQTLTLGQRAFPLTSLTILKIVMNTIKTKKSPAVVSRTEAQPSSATRAWFKAIFGVDPVSLAIPMIWVSMNRYSLDILAFERLLSGRFGYPKDKNGVSIKSFITDKWGAEACAYFETHFVKT